MKINSVIGYRKEVNRKILGVLEVAEEKANNPDTDFTLY